MTPDEFQDFTADDLKHLNLALRAFPNVAHGLRAVVDVAGRLSFPVEGPDTLREGVASTGVRYGDSDIPIDSLADLMPEYYFPIESEDDFVSKVSDAAQRQREGDGPNLPRAVLMEATAARRGDPPDISDERFFEMTGISRDDSGPAVSGLRRRRPEGA